MGRPLLVPCFSVGTHFPWAHPAVLTEMALLLPTCPLHGLPWSSCCPLCPLSAPPAALLLPTCPLQAQVASLTSELQGAQLQVRAAQAAAVEAAAATAASATAADAARAAAAAELEAAHRRTAEALQSEIGVLREQYAAADAARQQREDEVGGGQGLEYRVEDGAMRKRHRVADACASLRHAHPALWLSASCRRWPSTPLHLPPLWRTPLADPACCTPTTQRCLTLHAVADLHCCPPYWPPWPLQVRELQVQVKSTRQQIEAQLANIKVGGEGGSLSPSSYAVICRFLHPGACLLGAAGVVR